MMQNSIHKSWIYALLFGIEVMITPHVDNMALKFGKMYAGKKIKSTLYKKMMHGLMYLTAMGACKLLYKVHGDLNNMITLGILIKGTWRS